MTEKKTPKSSQYTCDDYRLEMRLLGIRQQLNNTALSESEREKLEAEMNLLEKELGLS